MKQYVWYWPDKDQLMRVYHLGKNGYLMFFSEDRYYFHPIKNKKTMRYVGIQDLGEL